MSLLSKLVPTFVTRCLNYLALRFSTFWHFDRLVICFSGMKEDYVLSIGTDREKFFDTALLERLRTAIRITGNLYEDGRYEEARATAIAGYQDFIGIRPQPPSDESASITLADGPLGMFDHQVEWGPIRPPLKQSNGAAVLLNASASVPPGKKADYREQFRADSPPLVYLYPRPGQPDVSTTDLVFDEH